ncbi:MAG: hypothetical protein U0V74_11450 [Chitinophagales bacterium]
MNSFLTYLEKAWIIAAVVSFIVGIVNFIRLGVFDNHAYFPLFCGLFCVLIWNNVRGQRKFRDMMDARNAEKQSQEAEKNQEGK